MNIKIVLDGLPEQLCVVDTSVNLSQIPCIGESLKLPEHIIEQVTNDYINFTEDNFVYIENNTPRPSRKSQNYQSDLKSALSKAESSVRQKLYDCVILEIHHCITSGAILLYVGSYYDLQEFNQRRFGKTNTVYTVYRSGGGSRDHWLLGNV